MSTQKLEDKNVRKITKVGRSSLCVTLPIEMVRKLGWKEKQKVKASRIKGGIVIRDWKK